MSVFNRLRRDERGNVAIIFGISAIPLIFSAGAALDYGQASHLKTKLQAAVDGTSLTLCQTPLSTEKPQLEEKARALIAAYMPEGATLMTPLPITSDPRQITVTATASYSTAFVRIMNINTMTVSATARCATPAPRIFEIALVLDTTGSMETSDGTATKLQSAQRAAKDFVTYIYQNPAIDSRSRISIVPFASAVAVDPNEFGASTSWIDRAGQSAYHWANIDVPGASQPIKDAFRSRLDIFSKLSTVVTSWKWAGCFETLPYPLNVGDTAPAADNPNSLYVPMFAPDEPGAATTGIAQIDGQQNQVLPSTNDSYTSLSPSRQYYLNSYLKDNTGTASCPAQAMDARTAERRACKYFNPSQYASSGSGAQNGPNLSCTSLPLQRLTTETAKLRALIDKMTPLGNTNIFEGLMWGWRTISPNSVFADGAAYNTQNTNKVIVLMTDGENTWSTQVRVYGNNYSIKDLNINGSLYSSMGYLTNGDGSTVSGSTGPAGRIYRDAANPNPANPANDAESRAALDRLTAKGCRNARAAGIAIFTIGFSVPGDEIDADGLTLLRNCASDPVKNAFVANSADSLKAAFDNIALTLGQLRLTR